MPSSISLFAFSFFSNSSSSIFLYLSLIASIAWSLPSSIIPVSIPASFAALIISSYLFLTASISFSCLLKLSLKASCCSLPTASKSFNVFLSSSSLSFLLCGGFNNKSISSSSPFNLLRSSCNSFCLCASSRSVATNLALRIAACVDCPNSFKAPTCNF